MYRILAVYACRHRTVRLYRLNPEVSCDRAGPPFPQLSLTIDDTTDPSGTDGQSHAFRQSHEDATMQLASPLCEDRMGRGKPLVSP